MRKTSSTFICLLALVGIITIQSSFASGKKKKITDYCPRPGEVENWSPERKPRLAEGEDLYLLINGGADIYLEYGFKQTVFQTYVSETGNRINLEIYEMNCPDCAYGIYTFKTGETGKPADTGDEGWMEEYYLNFRKGNFLVTCIGLDSEQTTMDGLEKIARAVDAKIDAPRHIPSLINYLPKEDLIANGITYLKGNLGLFNQYEFDSKNVFGLREGVLGKYRDHSLFIFAYKDMEESFKWYDSAGKHLQENGYFHDFEILDDMFSMIDRNGFKISVRPYKHTILIFFGNYETDENTVFALLEKQIDRISGENK